MNNLDEIEDGTMRWYEWAALVVVWLACLFFFTEAFIYAGRFLGLDEWLFTTVKGVGLWPS